MRGGQVFGNPHLPHHLTVKPIHLLTIEVKWKYYNYQLDLSLKVIALNNLLKNNSENAIKN